MLLPLLCLVSEGEKGGRVFSHVFLSACLSVAVPAGASCLAGLVFDIRFTAIKRVIDHTHLNFAHTQERSSNQKVRSTPPPPPPLNVLT